MRKKALAALPVMETKMKQRLVGVRIDGDTLVLDCWSGGKYQGRYCIRENGEYMSFVNGVWQQQKLCDVLSGVRYRGYCSYAENGKAFDKEQEKLAEQFFAKFSTCGYNIESNANRAEAAFMANKRLRREQRRLERIAERMGEVPVLPDGFEEWVKAVPFEGKQFLFKGKRTDEYICTACGKTHRMKNLKQNQQVVCTRTGLPVKVDKKRSQRASSCHVMVVQWMNEEKDERVARHLLVDCLWDTAGQHIETCEQVRYVLKSTGCNEWYYGQRYRADEFEQWWDEHNPRSFHCYREYCYPEGVKELLAGTVYENIGIPEMAAKGWAVWYNKLMIYSSSCHVMEYLVKGGYRCLTEQISANIYWGSDCVNYHGGTLQEVLKIDKQRANRLRQANGGLHYLRWMQWESRTGRRLSEETVRWLQQRKLSEGDLSFIIDQMSPEQVMHYLERQAKESRKSERWLLDEWKDTLLRFRKQARKGENVMEMMVNVNSPLSAEEQAKELHKSIVYNYRAAAHHLVEAAKCLKEMRDTKAYLSLGMESFEDYTEQMAGIKARQAYTYIATLERLGQPMMEEQSSIGITKLSLLAEITPVEREAFAAENDLAGMTVKEIEELIAENTRRGEQISLFEEKEAESAAKLEEREDTIADLLKEIEQLKQQASAEPVAVTATVEPDPAVLREKERAIKEKLKKDFEKKMEAERVKLQKEVQAAKKTAEQAEADKATAEQRVRQEMAAAYEEQLNSLRREMANAEAKATASHNEVVQKFAFHFEAVQREFDAMMSLVEQAPDSDTANRLTGAALKLVRQMEKRFGGDGV